MKKIISIAIIVLMTLFCITGCNSNNDYEEELNSSGIFLNTVENSYAQTKLYTLADAHLKSGDNKKVAIITFDGARADGLFNICLQNDKRSGENVNSALSGINTLRENGGLYLMYCGGEFDDKATKQATSTSPGFATILTGKWGSVNGCRDNGEPIIAGQDTILKTYSEAGKNVSFTARWDDHFSVVFKNEFITHNENYIFNKSTSETQTHELAKAAVARDDMFFVIYESPDYNGHSEDFSLENYKYNKSIVDSDRYAYELIELISARQTELGEDWLIIITTDHGGKGTGHGKQDYESKIIWFATNKKL